MAADGANDLRRCQCQILFILFHFRHYGRGQHCYSNNPATLATLELVCFRFFFVSVRKYPFPPLQLRCHGVAQVSKELQWCYPSCHRVPSGRHGITRYCYGVPWLAMVTIIMNVFTHEMCSDNGVSRVAQVYFWTIGGYGAEWL